MKVVIYLLKVLYQLLRRFTRKVENILLLELLYLVDLSRNTYNFNQEIIFFRENDII